MDTAPGRWHERRSSQLRMPMKTFFLRFFTWWNGQTFGTQVWTCLYGEPVGEDEFGNRYYQNSTGKRRWVIYNGTVEASRVPPDWHGWLHHTTDKPLDEKKLPAKPDACTSKLAAAKLPARLPKVMALLQRHWP